MSRSCVFCLIISFIFSSFLDSAVALSCLFSDIPHEHSTVPMLSFPFFKL